VRLWVCTICQHDKTKDPGMNDLKLGAVVVLDTAAKPIDFEFNRSRSGAHGRHFEILATAAT